MRRSQHVGSVRGGFWWVVVCLGLGLGAAACTAANPFYCDPARPGACDDDPGPGGDQGSVPDGGAPHDVNPGEPGPLATVRFDLTVPTPTGEMTVTVIGPSSDGRTLSRKGAPFPLVLLAPGFTIDRTQFADYGERLASYGIVTVLYKGREWDHARYRDDAISLLSWLLNPSGRSAGAVAGRLDGKRVGIAGHSLGGKIAILVAARDPRVQALLAIDPVDGPMDGRSPSALLEIGKIRLPADAPIGMLGEIVSKQGSPMACTPAGLNYEALYAKAAPPVFAITFNDAAHGDFVDDFDACATCSVCSGGSAPRDRTHGLAVKYLTAYFLVTLKQELGARTYLAGPEFQKDKQAGWVSLVAN